jgi:UDP-N-acetylglucosamine/UDP-N-acetylgalactosamine 4-epimerase
LLSGNSCLIFGDGETTRDFCYVANVVQANILAATADDTATREAYNVACARSVSLNELFHLLRDELARSQPSFASATPQYDAFRAGDVRFSCAGIEKARKMLSFSPTHDVGAGIAEALPWYVGKASAAKLSRSDMKLDDVVSAPLDRAKGHRLTLVAP